MEAVIFIGIQATGKTTLYSQRFFNTHVRISLDLLRTRHREMEFLRTCLKTSQRFVVDNTNPTTEDRKRYIEVSRAKGFRIVGYYFQSSILTAINRNSEREEGQRIPEKGISGTYAKLQLPTYSEGFDELHYVKITKDGEFIIERWMDEV